MPLCKMILESWSCQDLGQGLAASLLWSQAVCALCWMKSHFSNFHQKWSSIQLFLNLSILLQSLWKVTIGNENYEQRIWTNPIPLLRELIVCWFVLMLSSIEFAFKSFLFRAPGVYFLIGRLSRALNKRIKTEGDLPFLLLRINVCEFHGARY